MSTHTSRETRSGYPTFGLPSRPTGSTTGRGGLGFDSSNNPQILDDAGTVQMSFPTTGPNFPNGVGNAAEGAASSYRQELLVATNIPVSVATSVARITIPNANHSAVLKVIGHLWVADSADAFENTRLIEFQIAVTRVAGGAAVIVAGSLLGAAVAATGGGITFTVAATVTAASGAVGATNTSDIQLNITPSAGTPNIGVRLFVTLLNAVADGVTIAAV
jgi:hypothetical protein